MTARTVDVLTTKNASRGQLSNVVVKIRGGTKTPFSVFAVFFLNFFFMRPPVKMDLNGMRLRFV